MKFRQNADELLASERSASPATSPQVVEERLAADDNKTAERSATDAVLEHERERADAREDSRRAKGTVARATQEAHRRDTNERLSHERADADAHAAASESALEVARGTEANRADVFAMVTHDLRSPLCVIVANADLIAGNPAGEYTREAAEDITRAAARMGRLLTDLLDVARIDAGTFKLTRKPLDARALLSELRQSYRPLFDDSGVTLSVGLPAEPVVASFDHDRVVQMLANLLGNAMKFTPRGGHVALELEQQQGEEQLVFVVRDDGPGIDARAFPHLFERFWQQDPDRRRGLGLGLYLCRTIAEAHGGDISVQSQPGLGATFRVSLPM